MIAQEPLPLRIERNVGAIVVEQVEVEPQAVRLAHEAVVGFPGIRADQLRMPGAGEIDALDAVMRVEGRKRRLGLRRAVDPQRLAERIPRRRQAVLIGVGVLDDQPIECGRVASDDAEAHRAAIVLHEQAVMIEALGGEELFHGHRDRVERVAVGCGVGAIAVAEALVVRRDDVEARREGDDEVTILVRG